MQTLLTGIGILCLLLFAPKAHAHHGEAGMSLLERPQKAEPDASAQAAAARVPAGDSKDTKHAKPDKRAAKSKRKRAASQPITHD